jgi:hypothetical protein
MKMKTKETRFDITLSQKFLDKEGPAAHKRGRQRFSGEDEAYQKDAMYFPDEDCTIGDEAEVEYDENGLSITFGSDLGYFSFSIPLNLEVKVGIIEDVTKQFNKIKSMLESTK